MMARAAVMAGAAVVAGTAVMAGAMETRHAALHSAAVHAAAMHAAAVSTAAHAHSAAHAGAAARETAAATGGGIVIGYESSCSDHQGRRRCDDKLPDHVKPSRLSETR
jgi:hypothetical protein